MTQPTKVQPKKTFTTTTDPTFGGWRMSATIEGMKYKKMIRMIAKAAEAEPPASVLDAAKAMGELLL